MAKSIKSRIEKIEKELAFEDKTQWLRLPRSVLGLDGDPDELVEIKGCRTLADFLVTD